MANKKQNVFVRYFVPFGIRQISDIAMVIGSILLILGMCLFSKAGVLIVVGLGIFIAAALLSLVKAIVVLCSGINRRSPEFKNSIANIVILTIIIALAVFGIVWYFI